jgi:hypothetical protein
MTKKLLAVLAVLVPFAGGAGCGDDHPSRPVDESTNTLVFTRANSSIIPFSPDSRAYVWCGPWEEDIVSTPALHVWFGDPTDPESPGFWLQAVQGDLAAGDTLRFPHDVIWDQPDSALVFVWDRPNELSTSGEGSSGFIVFRQIPCDGSGVVEFTLDAVLDSELGDMPSVGVKGTFRSSVTAPPPWVGR